MRTFCVFFLLIVLHSAALIVAQRSSAPKNRTSSWQTLSGNAPIVVAKGGFSGVFPDSSSAAYSLALMTSLPNVVLWCDVQLTKDGAGICFPYLNLDNSSDISSVFKNKDKVYLVNGESMQGWFSVDYTLDELSNIFLTQGIYSRTERFNGNLFNVLTVKEVASQLKPPGLWLNIEHDAFFRQHNLSMRSYVLSISKSVIINYVSSPEVSFLRSITTRFNRSRTKLVFRFLGLDDTEPSTNQTYGSLLKNLTFVKTFASGILVPKTYIWPVDAGLYLQPHTSVVLDAHRQGLEVFASDFANDASFSYNYSYDPVAEYLSFIDSGNFSIDGVLSTFPLTPSEAIDCFSHISNNASGKEAKFLVISHNGASGMYPGCTDLAYKQAVLDGADVLDCSVQMTKDGIPFCLGSINLIDGTTVAQSTFSTRSIIIPEIQGIPGIFSFNLTWKEIRSISPAISNPNRDYRLFRNPAYKNAGTLITLDDFLALSKNTNTVSGILISIENAAYLAEKQSLSITDAVLDALSKAGYNNQTIKKVMIQSTNSSVLIKLKEKANYELVYMVDETIRDALNSTIMDIKKFANSVAISKASVFPDNHAFLTSVTSVVPKLHSFNLSVYVHLFANEFVSQAWDFFSDPTVEINSFVNGAGIDGVITDFPGTAIAYRKNRCLNMGDNIPIYMSPVQPGSLMQVIASEYLPPAEAPFPVLTDSDVVEPSLPPISKTAPTSDTGGSAPTSSPPSGQPRIAACVFLSTLAMLLTSLLLF